MCIIGAYLALAFVGCRTHGVAGMRFLPAGRYPQLVVKSSPASYLYFDGDDVGAAIELCLLEDDILGAREISRHVSVGVELLASALHSLMQAEVIFAAGDEVFVVTTAQIDVEQIQELRDRFTQTTGRTISCGTGASAAEATRQLHLAKLHGKNQTRIGFESAR